MKKIINYFYKLYPEKIYKKNNECYFYEDDYKYYIIEYLNKIDLSFINNFYNDLIKYIMIDNIVLNFENNYITNYNGKQYVMYRNIFIDSVYITINDILKYNIIINNNLILLVDELDNRKKEVDILEKQFAGYNEEFINIQMTFNYFIGLAENSISYLNDSINDCNDINMCLSHKEINLEYKSLLSITNITYNYKLKDVGMYVRLLIYNNLEWYDELENYLKTSMLNEFDYRYLFCEVLYPKEYFNYVSNSIFLNKEERKEFNISQLEFKFKILYDLINKYCKIPEIWWLK